MAPVLFIKAEGRLRKVKGEITCFYDIDKKENFSNILSEFGVGWGAYDTFA